MSIKQPAQGDAAPVELAAVGNERDVIRDRAGQPPAEEARVPRNAISVRAEPRGARGNNQRRPISKRLMDPPPTPAAGVTMLVSDETAVPLRRDAA